MNRVDDWRMIQRRAAELGTRARIGCHTFRATGITAYLEAGGTLENAQAMAAHESPRTTKYDRTGDEITLDEVERITIWWIKSSHISTRRLFSTHIQPTFVGQRTLGTGNDAINSVISAETAAHHVISGRRTDLRLAVIVVLGSNYACEGG